jgi:hypothetical protein
MWGTISIISLIVAIAFLTITLMAEKPSYVRTTGILMLLASLILSGGSFYMWYKNRNPEGNNSPLK